MEKLDPGRLKPGPAVTIGEMLDLFKTELIYPQGPWRGFNDVEFATLGYIDWFNHRRLHGGITDDSSYTTPAEFEAGYYPQRTPAVEAVTQ